MSVEEDPAEAPMSEAPLKNVVAGSEVMLQWVIKGKRVPKGKSYIRPQYLNTYYVAL